MIKIETPDYVEMDMAHYELIKATAMALKPSNILELGIGSGKVTSALIDAIRFNQPKECKLTVVDNWHDWNGIQPKISGIEQYSSYVTIVTASEEAFIKNAKNEHDKKYDIIVSDADHLNSHNWWSDTLSLLTDTGVAFFHDVKNPDYPKLCFIEYDADNHGWHTKVFNKSSRFTERCTRGLLMVYKN